MRDVMVSYDNLMTQYCWECFMAFFRVEKGYEDWTDEEIAMSMNEDDINEFCNYIKNNLSYDKKQDLSSLKNYDLGDMVKEGDK